MESVITQHADKANSEVDGQNNANGAEGHDETDVFGSSFFRNTQKTLGALMPVDKNAIFYNMNHKNRGIALVLNHEIFMPNMNLKPRLGTAMDLKTLNTTLTHLGFDVQCHNDLTVDGVNKVVERASKEDHTQNDCFLMACLTHGDKGILYAHDAPYKPEALWARFTADKCPSLAGKPKLFFIQACQGDKLDDGVTLFPRTQTDSSPSYKIPTHADFLIAYSTMPGHFSWRNTTKGSWFIQALCQELNENGYKVDLLTLLTFVNRKVAVDYESNCPDQSFMHGRKQVPNITFMLTRILKFSPKPASNEVK